MDVRFVPFPQPSKGLLYAQSQFRRTGLYSRALELLDYELGRINASDVTIQAGFRPEDVRIDGWPRGKVRPSHPGVIVQFRRRKGADVLTFKALRYGTYEENIYAIAMSLEALRAVDRYGVVEGQQYTGFKQIAAPAEETKLTREQRIIFMRDNAQTPGERQAAQAALDRLKAGT